MINRIITDADNKAGFDNLRNVPFCEYHHALDVFTFGKIRRNRRGKMQPVPWVFVRMRGALSAISFAIVKDPPPALYDGRP
jgi:hypothetical protein